MEFNEQEIPGVFLLEPKIIRDHRGFFYESWQEKLFESIGIKYKFVQENCAGSVKQVLRGLHYQIKRSQGKLIKVTSGTIFDVAVDIRKSSPTFGKWIGKILSAENKKQLWIPPNFAHGYYVISDWAEISYKTTDYYSPKHERTILWNDPEINIDWHLENSPILSDKDKMGKLLKEADVPE